MRLAPNSPADFGPATKFVVYYTQLMPYPPSFSQNHKTFYPQIRTSVLKYCLLEY
jgi:hypothetical protein